MFCAEKEYKIRTIFCHKAKNVRQRSRKAALGFVVCQSLEQGKFFGNTRSVRKNADTEYPVKQKRTTTHKASTGHGGFLFSSPCFLILFWYNINGDNMFDELTQVDIDKMKEELEYRITVVRPEILEEVKLTRSYGDLSENAEYHAAKRERGKNESRIRYLRNMIKTAKIIDVKSEEGKVGLFDTVTYYVEEDDAEEKVRIVTSLRRDPFENIISKESPLGSALIGAKVGDRIKVNVNEHYSYFIVVRNIEKGTDDDTLEIRKF